MNRAKRETRPRMPWGELKPLVVSALAERGPSTAAELVDAVPGTNVTSVRVVLSGLVSEGRVSFRAEKRKSLGSAWARPAGTHYTVTVYSLANQGQKGGGE